MTYIYTHGFRSSTNSQTHRRLCDGVGIAPLQLCYENGGIFMDNLLSLSAQLQAKLLERDSYNPSLSASPTSHASHALPAPFASPLDSENSESSPPTSELSKSRSQRNSKSRPCSESRSLLHAPFDFISHSLGAFYLWQLTLFAPALSLPRPRRLILFNPVFEPLTQLQGYIDKPQPNYTTNTPFILSQKAWESYAKARLDEGVGEVELLVYLARGDERINHKLSRPYWEKYGRVTDYHGGHSVQDFSPFRSEILEEA